MTPHGRTLIGDGAGWLCSLLLALTLMPAVPAFAGESPTVLLPEVLRAQNSQLASVDSNAGAAALFAASIGPSLGLRDAAGTIGAKGLPAKLIKELGIDDLARSAYQLVAALAVWQIAETAGQAARNPLPAEGGPPQNLSSARVEWLKTNSRITSLPTLLQLLSANGPEPAPRTELALTAAQAAFEANQLAIAAWWELHEWKDRVRLARGRARLCGTWQWVIHNHQQHHQEQKMSLIFPPPGPDRPLTSGLVETVVIGENVYLRWEINGQVQEDSLQFSKEGQRLEGTFVNSQGGWGSITGKRTADCQP